MQNSYKFIPVPLESHSFEITNAIMNSGEYKDSTLWFRQANYYQKAFNERDNFYEILGTVTANTIDFDANKDFGEEDENGLYVYRQYFGDLINGEKNLRESLKEHGIDFKSPHNNNLATTGHILIDARDNWGKVVILKKIK